MREIKFKQPIWNNGKIIKWHYWGFKDGLYQQTTNQHESYQFTGIKDRNGVEIYEGDILHWNFMTMFSSKKGEIREDTYAQVVWAHAGFTFNKIKGHLRSLDMESAEVVGNALESPEIS